MESKRELREIIESVLRENPNLFDSLMDMMLFKEDPAYYFSEKAIKIMVDEEAYERAIPFINAGLNINDPKRNIQFLRLRGECKFRCGITNNWKLDYLEAINAVDEAEVKRNDLKADIFLELYEIYKSVNDLKSALEHINKAIKYAEISVSNYYNYECRKERSKLFKEMGMINEAEIDQSESEKYHAIFEKEEEVNPSTPLYE